MLIVTMLHVMRIPESVEASPGEPFHDVRRRPTQKRSQQRFDEILAAATSLIAERGLAPITMKDIADRADMGVPAVYRYFPNKQSIVRELASSLFDSDEQMTLAFAEKGAEREEQSVANSLASYCRHYRSDHARLQIRTAIHADAELSVLDLTDSRRNAAVIAAAVDRPELGIPRLTLERRALIILELLDGVIRLASRVEIEEGDAVIDDFAEMASSLLFRPVTDYQGAPHGLN